MIRHLVMASAVLLVAGCHVTNRVYNSAIDPQSGMPVLESVVAIKPTAGQPDVVAPDCTPNLDLQTGYACMAFLEFDEMGESWDRRQLPEALALIERAKRIDAARPPIVVVFVHGWKNNASREPMRRNGNVNGFEGVLEYLRRRVYPDLPVVGIYVGWRGDLIPKHWPVRRQLSYFNRESAALRIPGASMTSALIDVAKTAHHERPDAYVLMIGHSFGALVLERALSQAMADYALRVAASAPRRSDTPDGGWSDLAVFVNSAGAANEGKQMLDLLKNRTVFVLPDAAGVERRRPLFLSVSSLGDAATRFLLPVGHGPSFLGFKTNGSFRPYTEADAPQPPVRAQSAYYTSTMAHMQAVQSHVILEGPSDPADAADTALTCGEGTAGPTPFGDEFTLPNTRKYRVCEKAGRWNDTPYWAMQMPASIVRDHSSIFTEDMVGLLDRFLVKKSEITSARPQLLPAVSPARVDRGSTVTLRGAHFGSSGSVTVGLQRVPAANVTWSDTIVMVVLPADVPPGRQRVVITAEDGSEHPFPYDALTIEESGVN